MQAIKWLFSENVLCGKNNYEDELIANVFTAQSIAKQLWLKEINADIFAIFEFADVWLLSNR